MPRFLLQTTNYTEKFLITELYDHGFLSTISRTARRQRLRLDFNKYGFGLGFGFDKETSLKVNTKTTLTFSYLKCNTYLLMTGVEVTSQKIK